METPTACEVALFWAKVDKHGPRHPRLGFCWVWTGALERYGYGELTRRRKVWRAHRYSWDVVHALPRTVGLVLDHLCLNRRCVRPSHLQEVTHGENIRRGYVAKAKPTHCPAGHSYPEHGRVNSKGSYYCTLCMATRQEAGRRSRGVQPAKRLTPQQREEAVQLRSQGTTFASIGQEFGVSAAAIHALCSKR